MNIAVIQPQGHGSGATTIASVIAYGLAKKNRKVCLTNAKTQSESLFPFFAVDTSGEMNNTAFEFLNLIKLGGIQKDKVINYTRPVTDNLSLFVIDAPLRKGYLTEDDLVRAVEFLGERSPFDYVVYDVDEKQMQAPAARKIFDLMDVCILTITQDKREIARFAEEMEAFAKVTRNVPSLVVVNKYDPILSSDREIAESLGIKNTKNWSVMHFNSYIPLCSNSGRFAYLCEQIHDSQPEVIELNRDVWHIIQKIMKIRKLERTHRIEAMTKKAGGPSREEAALPQEESLQEETTEWGRENDADQEPELE